MYGYMLSNVAKPAGKFSDYAVSVDRIEEASGLDLFPGTPEELEAQVNQLR
jgi:DNA/RNA endonuclease G (NUC1)